jgi:uncharacterized protein YdeI (YjbR/CyaY-like superfamily)
VKPRFFTSAADFRRWLEKNHAQPELWVAFYKKASGRGGLTYKEALDEALCFGWIDGVRKRLDEEAFVQRFTPRTAKSYWSAVNIRRAEELAASGRMHETGLVAFARRDKDAAERYSFERQTATLDAAAEKQFRARAKAWEFFQSAPSGYRRLVIHWVTSAKRPETRQRRLETLIRESGARRRIALVTSKKPSRT